jgi:pSer/pThr/pTyr-binding forkhead associated (FHA) protein
MEKGPSEGETFRFSDQVITIGRDEGPEINFRIQSPTISRRHARLSRVADDWQVEDLGSSNGTFLNSQKIGQSPVRISSGDRLQLGGTIRFIVHLTEQSEKIEHSKPIAATVMADEIEYPTATTPPQLIVTVAGTNPQSFELTKNSLTIGRSPENDIVIGSKIVSRHHARLGRR